MSKQKQQSTFKLVMGLIGALFSFAHVALADPWTNGGSAIYVTDTSDIVGIGTTSPDTMLHIIAPTGVNDSAHFRSDNASSDLYIGAAASGVSQIRTPSSQGLSIATNNTERIRISSSGNVGIGVTSADTLLHVVVPTGVNDSAHFRSDNASSDLYIGAVASGVSQIRAPSGQGLSIATDNTERIRISSTGNVGIGITSPGSKLDVNGDITLNNTLYGSSGVNVVLQAQSGKDLIIKTDGNNERMRITSTGQVGIGAIPNSTTDLAIGDTDTGLDQVSDGILGVKTNNVEALRVNINQDVRIGSSTGTGRLYIEKADQWAVYGLSSAGSDDYGSIYGEASNSGNYNSTGIFGVTQGHGNVNGQPLGVRGDARYTGSPSGGQFGVLGYNYSQGSGADVDSAGVWGGSVGTPGAEAEFNTYGNGVQGETYSKSNTSGGGIFLALSDDGQADGVVGKTYSSNGNSYGVYSSGDFGASGSKSAVVYTESQGPTQLYAEESTGVYFTDYGNSQLNSGSVKVSLDPLFLETVTVSDDELYYVFIQSYGDAVMSVKRSVDSFEVNKVYGSDDNAQFSYRIVAKRKYYEDKRLLPTKVEIDNHMRPDLGEAELGSLNDRWDLQYFTREELLPDLQSEPERLLLKD